MNIRQIIFLSGLVTRAQYCTEYRRRNPAWLVGETVGSPLPPCREDSAGGQRMNLTSRSTSERSAKKKWIQRSDCAGIGSLAFPLFWLDPSSPSLGRGNSNSWHKLASMPVPAFQLAESRLSALWMPSAAEIVSPRPFGCGYPTASAAAASVFSRRFGEAVIVEVHFRCFCGGMTFLRRGESLLLAVWSVRRSLASSTLQEERLLSKSRDFRLRYRHSEALMIWFDRLEPFALHIVVLCLTSLLVPEDWSPWVVLLPWHSVQCILCWALELL